MTGIETYGSALKKVMKAAHLTARQIAEYIGYDVSYISKWSSNAKLPSSRSIDRINGELGGFIAEQLKQEQAIQPFCQAMNFSCTEDDLAGEISQYLSDSYRSALQKRSGKAAEMKSTVRMITGVRHTASFITDILRQQIHADQNGDMELLIYGDFCLLQDIGFWSVLQNDHPRKGRLHVTAGLDLKKAEEKEAYVRALYHLLNTCLEIDFTFYDIQDMGYGNMIILKDHFVLQYALLPSQGFIMCTYMEGMAAVQELYEMLDLKRTEKQPVMTHSHSPWKMQFGYRSTFYAARSFFFFLTNGIEYFLPDEVFNTITASVPTSQQSALNQLRITWEELLNRAAITLVIPMTSLFRYLKTGRINLTDIQYSLTPAERLSHLDSLLHTLKANPAIQTAILEQNPETDLFQENNVSFYSNYQVSFFNKNPFAIHNGADTFYVIKNKKLQRSVLLMFLRLKTLPQYHVYTEQSIKEKYNDYEQVIHRILTTP